MVSELARVMWRASPQAVAVAKMMTVAVSMAERRSANGSAGETLEAVVEGGLVAAVWRWRRRRRRQR